MNVEILIVTFARDIHFLRYCLRSIHKFATGFSGVTIVVPAHDYDAFQWVKEFGAKVAWFQEVLGKGMLHHEAQIIASDLWCPTADAILHLDSDCMFWEAVTPADYLIEGRAVLYRERFTTLTNKIRLKWKEAVMDAIGIDPEWETMVRHPAIHWRATYVKTRELIELRKGRHFEEYILSCENSFPQTFAEFPTLGTVAMHHFPALYHFVDYDVTTHDGGYLYDHGEDKLVALWSHGGIDQYRQQCEDILK